uniref:Fucosyltransferase n=1 Tax=Phallusia mammillata TaxID=59560 RepID=A0A6F9DDU4_9ASCI|nr:alpha-(1,3)-fucosyltransferase 6-like [Phallusia mammillata]
MKVRSSFAVGSFLTLLVVVITLTAFVYWTQNLNPNYLPTLDLYFADTYKGNSSGVILMWTHPWAVEDEGPEEGAVYGKCTVTYDLAQLEKADAVVFHYWLVPHTWLFYRHARQRFVWWSLESPWVVQWFENLDLHEHDEFFNWTMTYRRDADIYDPYYNLYDLWGKLERGKEAVDKIIAKKTGLVAWIVSECYGKKGAVMRMSYANQMLKILPEIDRYGECFGNRDEMPKSRTIEFVSTRKFYLSFENSLHCRDYVTEKFFQQGLECGTVPVVWGTKKSDYVAIAPPYSFIHAEDFESPEKLAEYLLYLDKNDTAYREYFRWREDPAMTLDQAKEKMKKQHPSVEVVTQKETGFLDLCNRLHADKSHQVITSLRKEFIESEPEDCIGKM